VGAKSLPVCDSAKPDVLFSRAPGRRRDAIKYYEAGMDMGLSRDVEESFRIFQGRILDEYEAIADEVGFHIIDATLSIEKQQQQMREIVVKELGESLKNGVLRMAPGEAHAAETTPSVL
jgi:dTMP kinase